MSGVLPRRKGQTINIPLHGAAHVDQGAIPPGDDNKGARLEENQQEAIEENPPAQCIRRMRIWAACPTPDKRTVSSPVCVSLRGSRLLVSEPRAYTEDGAAPSAPKRTSYSRVTTRHSGPPLEKDCKTHDEKLSAGQRPSRPDIHAQRERERDLHTHTPCKQLRCRQQRRAFYERCSSGRGGGGDQHPVRLCVCIMVEGAVSNISICLRRCASPLFQTTAFHLTTSSKLMIMPPPVKIRRTLTRRGGRILSPPREECSQHRTRHRLRLRTWPHG